MNENTGPALLAAGICFIWAFPFFIDEKLFYIQGRKSCLFEVLSVLIPVTPLVTLPFLIFLPSRQGQPPRINWPNIVQKSLTSAVLLSAFAGLATFFALYFLG